MNIKQEYTYSPYTIKVEGKNESVFTPHKSNTYPIISPLTNCETVSQSDTMSNYFDLTQDDEPIKSTKSTERLQESSISPKVEELLLLLIDNPEVLSTLDRLRKKKRESSINNVQESDDESETEEDKFIQHRKKLKYDNDVNMFMDENRKPWSEDKRFYLHIRRDIIMYDPIDSSLLDEKEKVPKCLNDWKYRNIKWRNMKKTVSYENFIHSLHLIKNEENISLRDRVEEYLFANPYKAIGKLYIIYPHDIPVVKKEYDKASYFQRMYSVLGWRKFWHLIYSTPGNYVTGFSPVKVYPEHSLFSNTEQEEWVVLPHFRFKLPTLVYNWHYQKNSTRKLIYPKLYWVYEDFHSAKHNYQQIVKAFNEKYKDNDLENTPMQYPESVRIAMQ